jgi:hypothetical protein
MMKVRSNTINIAKESLRGTLYEHSILHGFYAYHLGPKRSFPIPVLNFLTKNKYRLPAMVTVTKYV